MTLKQAFTIWSLVPRNTVLSANSRDAVNKCLMRKYADIHLEQFTEAFCRKIFRTSTEPREFRVKAASILAYVLQCGNENGHCKKPSFGIEIVPPEDEAPKKDSPRAGFRQIKDTLDPTVQQTMDSIEEKENTNIEPTDMNTKKSRGKLPRKVCQIDPETLQVVKTFDSCAQGCKAAGVKNIDRAIKRMQKAGGWYWAYPEDAGTFAQRLQDRPQAAGNNRSPEKSAIQNEGQGAAMTPAPHPSPGMPDGSIGAFTDQQLKDELRRRGWRGRLSRMEEMVLE